MRIGMQEFRGLFRSTRMVQRTGALKYNMPKRYARAPGDEVKMTFDHQAAAKIAGTAMGTMSAFWMILANFLAIFWFIPVKYSINDLLDSARPHLSDIQAASGYFLFVLEMEGQRMRAYEFLRLRGRPGQGQGQEEVKRTNMSTMGGVGAWDIETGRPRHSHEGATRLEIFNDNPVLERQYHERTRADMERINHLRSRLAEIRSEMTDSKRLMYQKAME